MSVPDIRFHPHAMRMALQDGPRTPGQDSLFFGNLEGPGDLDETASETSSLALSEQFSATDMPHSCSPAPSEKSVPADITLPMETDKRPRATRWYTDELDAGTGPLPPPTERLITPVPAERRSPGQRPKNPSDKVSAALSRAGRQMPSARASDEMCVRTNTESVSTSPSEEKACISSPTEHEQFSAMEMFIAGSAEDMVSHLKVFLLLSLHQYALPFTSLKSAIFDLFFFFFDISNIIKDLNFKQMLFF